MPAVRRDWTAAEDNAVFALRALGWTGAKIAAALGRSPISLEHHLRRLRKAGSAEFFKTPPPTYPKVKPTDVPIEGETWTEVAARGLCVSSHGRVTSLRSGHLRSLFKQSFNGKLAVNYETAEKRGTITLENLVREANGEPPPPRTPVSNRSRGISRRKQPKSGRRVFSASEDSVILEARTSQLAHSLLTHRTLRSVQRRARILGVRYVKWEPAPAGSGPRGRADYDAAQGAVPKSYPPDVREDLINDIVIMQLEGFPGDAQEAFRIAKARHYRKFDQHRTVSIDAILPGTDDFRLSDVISSDHPHF